MVKCLSKALALLVYAFCAFFLIARFDDGFMPVLGVFSLLAFAPALVRFLRS